MSATTPVSEQAGRPGAPTGLARLVAIGRDEFADQHWGTQPLLSRAGELPAPFADLLSNDAVDELLSRRGLRTPFVRVAKGGRTMAERDFTRPGGTGAMVADQVSDTDLTRLFADGHTIVLQGLHRTWGPLTDFVHDLADDLGHPVQANAYITPPQSTGFSAHYDVHDVFVMQVSGEKTWRIHEPVLRDPLRTEPWGERSDAVGRQAEGEPYLEATLQPGDCLYLPRGWLHSATALGGVSNHITLGVHTWQGGHVLDAVVAEARMLIADDPELRASLDLGVDVADAATYGEEIEAARDALGAAMGRVDPARVAARVAAQRRGTARPSPTSPVRTTEQLGQMRAAPDRWRLRLREHLDARLLDGVLLSRAGRLRIAEEHEGAITRLLRSGALAVDDVGAEVAARLVTAGVAVLEPA